MIVDEEVKKILLTPSADPTRGYITFIQPSALYGSILFNTKTYRRAHFMAVYHGGTKMSVSLGAHLIDEGKTDACPPRLVSVDTYNILSTRLGMNAPYIMICDGPDTTKAPIAGREAHEPRKTPDLVLGNPKTDPFLRACLVRFGMMSLDEMMECMNLYFAVDDVGSKPTALNERVVAAIHFQECDGKTSGQRLVRLVLGFGRLVSIYRVYLRARTQFGGPLKFSPDLFKETLLKAPGMRIDLCHPDAIRTTAPAPAPASASASAAPVAAAQLREEIDYRDLKITLTALMFLGCAHTQVAPTMTIALSGTEPTKQFVIDKISLSMGEKTSAFGRVLGFVWTERPDSKHTAVLIHGAEQKVKIGRMDEKLVDKARARMAFSDSEDRGSLLAAGLSLVKQPDQRLVYASDWIGRLSPIDFEKTYENKLKASLHVLVYNRSLFTRELLSDEKYAAHLSALVDKTHNVLSNAGKEDLMLAAHSEALSCLDRKVHAIAASEAAEDEATQVTSQRSTVSVARKDEEHEDKKKKEEQCGDQKRNETLSKASTMSLSSEPSAAGFVPPPPPSSSSSTEPSAPPPSPLLIAAPVSPAAPVAMDEKPDKREKTLNIAGAGAGAAAAAAHPVESKAPKRKAVSQTPTADEDEDEPVIGPVVDKLLEMSAPPAKKARSEAAPAPAPASASASASAAPMAIDTKAADAPGLKCVLCSTTDTTAVFLCATCQSRMTHGGGMPDDMSQLRFLIGKVLEGQARIEAELKQIRSVKMDESD